MAYQLYLEYKSAAGGKLYLDGANITAPVTGCKYSPGSGKRWIDPQGRELITEDITVTLTGTYRQITDWVNLYTQLCIAQQIGARHPITGIFSLRLVIQEADEATYAWQSYIQSAELLLDANGLAQRKLGKQLVTLRVTREDRWEYNGCSAQNIYFFPSGDQTTQTYMLNHHDSTAGHVNFGYVALANVKGDLPNRVDVMAGTFKSGRSMGDFYLGCGWSDAPSTVNLAYFLNTLQESAFTAGASASKTDQSSAAAAGGAYADFAWSDTSETQVCYANIPSNLYAYQLSHGRPLKPIIRLQAGTAVSDLWLKAKILVGGTSVVVYETEWVLYQNNYPMIELPPVYAPPEFTEETSTLDIALYARKTSGSSYTLSIDFMQLWPVDGGFRKLKPLSYVSGNGYLHDDVVNGAVYWDNPGSTTKRATLSAAGSPITMLPGRYNMVYFAHIAGGTSWTIDDEIYLAVTPIYAKRFL